MYFCVNTATVFNNANQQINVYGDDVEVDYRGYEVKSTNLLHLLLHFNSAKPNDRIVHFKN